MKWYESLLIFYLIGNIVPALAQAIIHGDELTDPRCCIGCVIDTYNYLKDELNVVGLWIAVIFVFLLTLPAIILSFIVWLIMALGILFWNLFVTVFAKKYK